MADVADRSDDVIAAHLERSLAAHRANALCDEVDPVLLQGAPRDCVDCGLAVPAERVAAMPYTVRCIECQHVAEASRWL